MNTRTTLMLAVVLAVAAAGLWMAESWRSREAERRTEAPATVLGEPPPARDAIVRIELERRRGGNIVFEKQEGDEWEITEPVRARADSLPVKAILDDLLGLRSAGGFSAEGPDALPPEETGLAEPRYVVRGFDAEGQRLFEVRVGGHPPLSSGTYVATAGSDYVHIVTTDLDRSLGKDLSDFRSKKLLDYTTGDVVRLAVAGKENFEITKDKAQVMFVRPVRVRAELSRVNSLLSSLRNIRALDFVDDQPEDLSIYGLDEPRLKITVRTRKEVEEEEGAEEAPDDEADEGGGGDEAAEAESSKKKVIEEEQTLLVGGKAGDRYFAKLGDRAWVCTVSAAAVDNLKLQRDYLQARKLAEVPPLRDVEQIEVEMDGSAGLLVRDGDDWLIDGEEPAEFAAVDDLVRSLRNLEVHKYEENPALLDTGLESPRLRLTLTVTGRVSPLRIRVGKETPSGEMVYVQEMDSGAVAVVLKDEVAPILKPIDWYRDRTIFDFNQAFARRVEITRPGEAPVVLARKESGGWVMESPVAGPADAERVGKLLTDLGHLRAQAVVGSGDLAAYGLDEPEVTVRVVVKPLPVPQVIEGEEGEGEGASGPETEAGADAAVEEEAPAETTGPEETEAADEQPADSGGAAESSDSGTESASAAQGSGQSEKTGPAGEEGVSGEPATQPARRTVLVEQPEEVYELHLRRWEDGSVYAVRADSDRIYRVDPSLYQSLRQEFFDRTIFAFDTSRVVRVRLVRNGEALDLVHAGEGWTYEQDPSLPVDAKKVEKFLDDLRNLKVDRYVMYSGASGEEHGLGEPAVQALVVLDDGQTQELRVSGEGPEDAPDSGRYATLAGSGRLFLLTPDQIGQVTRSVSDFRE